MYEVLLWNEKKALMVDMLAIVSQGGRLWLCGKILDVWSEIKIWEEKVRGSKSNVQGGLLLAVEGSPHVQWDKAEDNGQKDFGQDSID
jgi:hypothetical protein